MSVCLTCSAHDIPEFLGRTDIGDETKKAILHDNPTDLYQKSMHDNPIDFYRLEHLMQATRKP